jgi:TolA-binding protein
LCFKVLALWTYNKVIDFKSVDADYASYQQFVTDLYLKMIKKIEELNAFLSSYPKSNLRDDAMYELASTYVAASKTWD